MFPKAGPLRKRFCLLLLAGLLVFATPAPAQFAVNRPLWHDPMGFSQYTAEAKTALSQGAQILELPADGSFAVAWFPPGYLKQAPRRLMFVLHGDGSDGQTGSAYEALLRHIPMAGKHGYGLVALQWRRTGDAFMDPRDIQRVMSEMMPSLVSRYGVFPHMVGLDASGRSAEISYEIAYWDKLSKRNLFRIIIAQAGGIPRVNPKPLFARMLSEIEAKEAEAAKALLQSDMVKAAMLDKPAPVQVASTRPVALPKPASGKPAGTKSAKPPAPPPYPPGKALEGKQFFLVCPRQAEQPDPQICDSMLNARRIIEGQAGKVVQFIEGAEDGQDGVYTVPPLLETAVQAFIDATPGIR